MISFFCCFHIMSQLLCNILDSQPISCEITGDIIYGVILSYCCPLWCHYIICLWYQTTNHRIADMTSWFQCVHTLFHRKSWACFAEARSWSLDCVLPTPGPEGLSWQLLQVQAFKASLLLAVAFWWVHVVRRYRRWKTHHREANRCKPV